MKIQGIVSAAVMAVLCLTVPAHAIDKCKVKTDKKTGVLRVDASGVTGTLVWGETEGAESESFFNGGTCVTNGKAKKCQIADPSTLDAKTPPAGCTLYLDDDVAPCSVWIAGCTPGERAPEICVPDPAASPRYVDNGDGTVSDKTTCLMWEQKTDNSTVHDTDNYYAWSTGSPYNPDGEAFFEFLAELNRPSPFAGHDDWRLPTITELESIVDLSQGNPTIDETVFGPTQSDFYWSSPTFQNGPGLAWGVNFGYGGTVASFKTDFLYVRAVRAGS